MKIDFVRTGGAAGVQLKLALDTHDMSEEAASRLRQLVQAADFFEMESDARTQATQPDRFEYHLTIDSQVWGRNEVVLPEAAVPDDARPLLDYLTSLALHRPPEQGPDPKPGSQGS